MLVKPLLTCCLCAPFGIYPSHFFMMVGIQVVFKEAFPFMGTATHVTCLVCRGFFLFMFFSLLSLSSIYEIRNCAHVFVLLALALLRVFLFRHDSVYSSKKLTRKNVYDTWSNSRSQSKFSVTGQSHSH